MRARFGFAILTGCLAATAAAGGCQIISRLNDLQVGTGGSSNGGAASSSASATASTATSTATSTVASSTSTVASSSSSTVASSSSSASASSSTSGGACDDAGSPGCGSPCPTCAGGTCTPTCSSACDTTIHADMGASAVQCTDTTSCVGKTFTCTSGIYLCELDCTVSGACTGSTTLQCSDGPCRLNCAGQACGMGTTLICGSGPCDVVYSVPSGGPPAPVQQQNCSGSCDCTGHNNDSSGPPWMPPPADAG